jgi:hypothetical protein
MRRLLLTLLLLAPFSALAVPTPVQAVFKDCGNSTCTLGTTSCQATIATTGGNTVIVYIMHGTSTISSVVDSGGSTYTPLVTVTQVTDGEVVRAYGVLSANASTTVTVNVTPGEDFAITVAEYSGVAAFGNTTSSQADAQTTLTQTLNLQDANNIITGAYYGDAGPGNAWTVTVGNQRNKNFVACFNNGENWLVLDNAGGPGNTSITATIASAQVAGIAIELRSATGSVPSPTVPAASVPHRKKGFAR